MTWMAVNQSVNPGRKQLVMKMSRFCPKIFRVWKTQAEVSAAGFHFFRPQIPAVVEHRLARERKA
jgi:hypothetical protein